MEVVVRIWGHRVSRISLLERESPIKGLAAS